MIQQKSFNSNITRPILGQVRFFIQIYSRVKQQISWMTKKTKQTNKNWTSFADFFLDVRLEKVIKVTVFHFFSLLLEVTTSMMRNFSAMLALQNYDLESEEYAVFGQPPSDRLTRTLIQYMMHVLCPPKCRKQSVMTVGIV